MIKWVFFDLDGVLVDSMQWHTNAFNEALINEGIKLQRHEHSVLEGLPTKMKLELLAKTYDLCEEKKSRILLKKQEVTVELLVKLLKPNETLKNLLSELRRRGIKMAVCSNAVRETVDLCLKHMEIEEFFEFTFSNQDVKEPKPSPEVYHLALERAGIKAREALIIEDSPHGLKAARESSCQLLAVKNAAELSWSKIEEFLKPEMPR